MQHVPGNGSAPDKVAELSSHHLRVWRKVPDRRCEVEQEKKYDCGLDSPFPSPPFSENARKNTFLENTYHITKPHLWICSLRIIAIASLARLLAVYSILLLLLWRKGRD
jgi:hypothetical protein